MLNSMYVYTDVEYTRQWLRLPQTEIRAHFAWIVGRSDCNTKPTAEGWQTLVTGDFQRVVFAGDHFFLFSSPQVTVQVVDECVHIAQRIL